jgi:hypothetical protein
MTWSKWFGGASGKAPGGRRVPVSRRAFLGGGAAVVALPFLESLRNPAGAAATAPVRTLFWYVPCGIRMEHWRPDSTGRNYDLKRILAPIAPMQDKVSVFTGLANRAASVPVAGDHARGTGSFLTCMECRLTDGDDIENGISIDQVIANEMGGQTLFRSLELGAEGGLSIGNCDSGYSCAYSRNISWLDEDTPLPKSTDPSVVYDRLFAGFDQSLTQEDIDRRKRWRTSVLDHALDDANALHGRLSTSDRAKLDEYLTGLRELEQRIQGADAGTCLPGARPEDVYAYEDIVRVMTDLQVKALECDLTRVITFMMENGGSYRSFDFIGVTGGHHELSHHQGDPTKLEALSQIGTWEMEQFNYLLQQMDSIVESNGVTLLDNSLVFLSSEISDGDRHNHDDLPVLLAGSGQGVHDAGRHVDLGTETPIADLFLAMAEAMGVSPGSFGQDGTAPLDLA